MSFFWTKEDGSKIEYFRFGRAFAAIIIFILALGTILGSMAFVPAGYRGVVTELGAVKPYVLNEGFNTIIPWIQSKTDIEVRTQKYQVDASAATKDLLDVKTTVAVNFHLEEKEVNTIYQTIGMNYEDRIISPVVQEVVKATTAKFNAEDLITQREAVKEQIDSALKQRLLDRGILVETTSITNFEFPGQFNQAIIDKQTAVQKALEAQNKLKQIEFEAQQAVAKANGDAQAIEIINQQLIKSPQYISYLATNKWDGKLPLATGGVLPFINIDQKGA